MAVSAVVGQIDCTSEPPHLVVDAVSAAQAEDLAPSPPLGGVLRGLPSWRPRLIHHPELPPTLDDGFALPHVTRGREEMKRRGMERLSPHGRIARSDIRRVVRWGDAVAVRDADTGEDRITNGVALRTPDEISDDDAAAISEVSLTREGLRVRLYPKQPALDALARHLGLNDRRAKLALPDTATAEGCAAAAAAILERVAAGELTIEQGQGLTAIIETRRRTIETAEIAAEVARLKELVEAKDGNGRT
jgi:hypothetical protein